MFDCCCDNQGLADLGYDPRYGGLAITPDGRCWQGGREVSCEDESPVYSPPLAIAPPSLISPLPTPSPLPLPSPIPDIPLPSPSTGPIYKHWKWRKRRPPVKRPYIERLQPVAAIELCPIRGYVAREIPGANEYQNFRCVPGQPVTIDPGLQAVGRREALARHGLSDLGDFVIGNIAVPQWALLAGASLLVFMFLKKRR